MRTILILAAMAGCVMSSSQTDLRGALRDAQDEEQLHVTESRASPDLSSLNSEVDRHSTRMTVILDEMRGDMSSMRHCSGMSTMMDMRDDIQTEIDDHQTTMRAMRDLAAARSEDEDHMTVMDGMLGAMDMQLDGMRCGGM